MHISHSILKMSTTSPYEKNTQKFPSIVQQYKGLKFAKNLKHTKIA